MKLRSYRIQHHRRDESYQLAPVPRIDGPALLDTLRYPLIWVQDEYISGDLPAEVDYAFLEWLNTIPLEFDPKTLPKGRLGQLARCGLLEPTRLSKEVLLNTMRAQGYVKIPQLVHGEWCRTMMASYYWRNEHNIERWNDMEGIKRTSVNNMPLSRLLHQLAEPTVKALVPVPVKTSYSFTSAYEPGTNLPAHTDRPQCVYNISMMLSSTPRRSLAGWPLWIRRNGQDNPIALEPGDAVLYSGTQDLHWRDKMPPGFVSVLGVFMHFVPEDFTGPLD